MAALEAVPERRILEYGVDVSVRVRTRQQAYALDATIERQRNEKITRTRVADHVIRSRRGAQKEAERTSSFVQYFLRTEARMPPAEACRAREELACLFDRNGSRFRRGILVCVVNQPRRDDDRDCTKSADQRAR